MVGMSCHTFERKFAAVKKRCAVLVKFLCRASAALSVDTSTKQYLATRVHVSNPRQNGSFCCMYARIICGPILTLIHISLTKRALINNSTSIRKYPIEWKMLWYMCITRKYVERSWHCLHVSHHNRPSFSYEYVQTSS